MAAYYAQRAAEYERVYHRPARQANLRALGLALAEAFDGRHGLEIACGTGWWTPHAAARAASWLATDLNPETMALARAKPMPACVRFAELDAYALDALGEARFDAAFAGCWWSHVPLGLRPGWLQALHARLSRGARVVMLDNRYVEGESTPISRRDADGNTYQQRTLDDGSTHEVLKNFPRADEAVAALGPRARDPRWDEGSHYWTLSYTLA
jgi:demethylmenaquinone methyltransferase/2-methoxy-6-polyprenyl-1,4-benzoquinol methylase